ncbi:MAG: hypothetical protein PHU40_01520 [Sulfurimonas sp.]|nr:hypothetical protein [Sulfurimonas sp.]
MNFIPILAVFSIFLGGCSQKSAFSNFELTRAQEFSISNTQRAKIVAPDKVEGAFTAVYLNNIYPEVYTQNDAFLICLYTKDDMNPKDLQFRSNANEALLIEKIEDPYSFQELIEMQNSWNSCYLMEFESNEEREIQLQIKSDTYQSMVLTYKKS